MHRRVVVGAQGFTITQGHTISEVTSTDKPLQIAISS